MFSHALELVLSQDQIKAETTVKATVSLYNDGPADFYIGVELVGHIEGLSPEDTKLPPVPTKFAYIQYNTAISTLKLMSCKLIEAP